jgi:hypothetical protein
LTWIVRWQRKTIASYKENLNRYLAAGGAQGRFLNAQVLGGWQFQL